MNAVLSREIKHIKELISTNRLKEAYQTCNKLLLNFPENRKLNKLQRKIEKIVFKQNVHSVKNDLKNLRPLWDEKKYGELVKKLSRLQSYVPGYAPLEKQLMKAKKLYKKHEINEQKDLIKKYIHSAEQNIKKHDYENALTLIKNILKQIPNHNQANELLIKTKHLLINKKIKENESLLKSNKFEEIQVFLKNLKNIDPESPRVRKLLEKAMEREDLSIELAKKDYEFKSYEYAFVLFRKKKYGKTIRALNELLAFHPGDKKFLTLLEKAKHLRQKEVDKEVVKKVINLQKKFKAEKKKNPKLFIKI